MRRVAQNYSCNHEIICVEIFENKLKFSEKSVILNIGDTKGGTVLITAIYQHMYNTVGKGYRIRAPCIITRSNNQYVILDKSIYSRKIKGVTLI